MEHGVPYALASAAYGRAGDESGSEDRGVSEREPNTRQYTRSRRDARISCMFCHRPGGGGGEGEARETAINTALRVRVSRVTSRHRYRQPLLANHECTRSNVASSRVEI